MASVNQVLLIGRVGQDPKIYDTQTGKKVVGITLATTEKGYKRQDGSEVQDKTDWHNITIFGRIAEVAQQYVHKGSLLCVIGKISYRKFKDKQGAERMATDIICDNLQLLDSRQQTESQQFTQQYSQPYMQQQNQGTFQNQQRGDLPF